MDDKTSADSPLDLYLRCTRKEGYSFARAKRIAKRMRRERDGIRVHEYYCRDHQKWHVGEG